MVIEAKLTEDDGAARGKVTRVQHLAALSEPGMPEGTRKFEIIARAAAVPSNSRRKPPCF